MMSNRSGLLALMVGAFAVGTASLASPAPVAALPVPNLLPHVLWAYTFRDNGDPHNPLAERYYLTRTYIGPHGEITIYADAGRCAFLKRFGETNEGVIRQRPWE